MVEVTPAKVPEFDPDLHLTLDFPGAFASLARKTVSALLVWPSPMFLSATVKRTISVAKPGNRSGWPSADRYSITKFCPSTYPNSRSPCRNASKLAFRARDLSSSTPIRHTFPAG
jgi:hypothetical protein